MYLWGVKSVGLGIWWRGVLDERRDGPTGSFLCAVFLWLGH